MAYFNSQDGKRLMELLTDEAVEVLVHDRVEKKSRTFGQVVEINGIGEVVDTDYKIEAGVIGNLYVDWIMPLTKQVQVEYLLRRLD